MLIGLLATPTGGSQTFFAIGVFPKIHFGAMWTVYGLISVFA
jgi:hypothetical protein